MTDIIKEMPVDEAQYRKTRACFLSLLANANPVAFPEQLIKFTNDSPRQVLGIVKTCIFHPAWDKLDDVWRVHIGPGVQGLIIPDVLSGVVTLVYKTADDDLCCIGLADGFHLADNTNPSAKEEVACGSVRYFPSLCKFLSDLAGEMEETT